MSPHEVAAAVGEAVDPTLLMQRVCDRTLELFETAQIVTIGLVSGDCITYVVAAGHGGDVVGTRVPVGASLSGLALTTGTIQLTNDTQCDSRVDPASCRRNNTLSAVVVPLSRTNEVYGVMAVNASNVNAFDDSDVAVLTQLADFVSVAIGSACDLDRASRQLLEIGHQHPADETTGRYVMNVLSPATVTRIDARRRIQAVLDSPDVLGIAFQPVVDLFSGAAVAVEALARFNVTPTRSPDEWFKDAHLAHCGPELEMLAISRALSYLPLIPNRIAVTINVGPETVVGANLEKALAAINARRVVLELTEHSAFEDYPGLRSALQGLRSTGVRLAVDDAGSGYSSLTHILKLAPDFIKLDRELISGIDVDLVRRALVTSLVAFSADTGAEIVAEGIETKDELDAVNSLGVRYAQGYFLGRPAPLETFSFDRRKSVRGLVDADNL